MVKLILILDSNHMKNNIYGHGQQGEEIIHSNILDLVIDKASEHKKFFILGEGIDNKYTIQYRDRIFDIEGENTSQFIISDKLLNGITLPIIDYLIRRKKSGKYDIILSFVKRVIDIQKAKEYVKIGTLFDQILSEYNKFSPNREKIYTNYLKLVKYTSPEYLNWCEKSLKEIMKTDPSKISNIGDIISYVYNKTLAIRDIAVANYMKKMFANGDDYCYCIVIGKNHEQNLRSLLTVFSTETMGKEELIESLTGGYYCISNEESEKEYYKKYMKYQQKNNNIIHQCLLSKNWNFIFPL